MEAQTRAKPSIFSYRCDSLLTVDHFKALAFSFRMTYAGPATETGGADLSKIYRLDDEVLPFFPDDVPARKRKTYWRWCKAKVCCRCFDIKLGWYVGAAF